MEDQLKNFKTDDYTKTVSTEIGNQQPYTSLKTENSVAYIVTNKISKQQWSISIDKRF